MCVFPIFSTGESQITYLSLKQALNQNLLLITEISQGGSVPELKVRNTAELPVLLLDGEEISGAKQNRILNTTILVKELSETIIPVSCTESGRWSYHKPHFEESGNVLSSSIRAGKMADVSQNLRERGSFRSDQGKVWEDISFMACKNEVSSPTNAMKDVYDAVKPRLEDYAEHFPCQDRQIGIIVCLQNRIAGLDCLSSDKVWFDLHSKLIRSYAMDSLSSDQECNCTLEQVHDFLEQFRVCEPQVFKSLGYGEDFRYESPHLIGSGLVWKETFIHLELYPRQVETRETHYHSPRHRL